MIERPNLLFMFRLARDPPRAIIVLHTQSKEIAIVVQFSAFGSILTKWPQVKPFTLTSSWMASNLAAI